jgi:hypothetical protein
MIANLDRSSYRRSFAIQKVSPNSAMKFQNDQSDISDLISIHDSEDNLSELLWGKTDAQATLRSRR